MAGISFAEVDAEYEARTRNVMELFGDEIHVDLRGVSVTLVHAFNLRLFDILSERTRPSGTLEESIMDDPAEQKELMDTIARQVVREMFGGAGTAS